MTDDTTTTTTTTTDADTDTDTDEWDDPPLEEDSTTSRLAHVGFLITLAGVASFFVMIGVVIAGGAPAWMATAPIIAVILGFTLVGAGTDKSEVGNDPQGGD